MFYYLVDERTWSVDSRFASQERSAMNKLLFSQAFAVPVPLAQDLLAYGVVNPGLLRRGL